MGKGEVAIMESLGKVGKRLILTAAFITAVFLFLMTATPAEALNFYLSPGSSIVNVGDIFGLEVGFNNSENVLFNGAVVTFSYDENYLQLQDTDNGNMPDSSSGPAGTNITDANHFGGWNSSLDMVLNQQEQYMSSHPYAIHYEVIYAGNEARNGVFGKAYFKALKATSSPTNLAFGSYYGEDEALYIDPDYNLIQVSGNMGASVNVVPEPASALLLGIGGFFVLSKIRRKK